MNDGVVNIDKTVNVREEVTQNIKPLNEHGGDNQGYETENVTLIRGSTSQAYKKENVSLIHGHGRPKKGYETENVSFIRGNSQDYKIAKLKRD